MTALVEAFDAGVRLVVRTLAPKIKQSELEIERMEKEILLLKCNLEHFTGPNWDAYQRIIFIMQTTDDNAARIKVQEKDRLGAAITGETLTATVDQPTKASVAQDPADPTAFIVTRLPLVGGDPDVLTVIVTIEDTASGMTGTQTVEFDPGKAAAMTFDTEIAPLPGAAAPPAPVAVGDTVTLPSNPADPASPPADHIVTAVAADGSTVTAQPAAGGDPVTVPATSVTVAANAGS